MTSPRDNSTRLASARIALLFCVFFLIACGLGYPVLNRYDPRQTPGLSDVKEYAALVTDAAVVDAGHVRFRVLLPWIARPFYRLARGRFATWDPVMFGLLVSDSLFIAGTAVLIVMLGGILARRGIGNSSTGLVAALLYLLNFAVPNLRLAGLVDAGEGFFLLAMIWSLSEFELWLLPIIGVFGALAKESFIPFSIVFAAAWWLTVRRDHNRDHNDDSHFRRHLLSDAAWIVISWALSLATMIVLQWAIRGRFEVRCNSGSHCIAAATMPGTLSLLCLTGISGTFLCGYCRPLFPI